MFQVNNWWHIHVITELETLASGVVVVVVVDVVFVVVVACLRIF